MRFSSALASKVIPGLSVEPLSYTAWTRHSTGVAGTIPAICWSSSSRLQADTAAVLVSGLSCGVVLIIPYIDGVFANFVYIWQAYSIITVEG